MPGWPICSTRTSLSSCLSRENQYVLREGYVALPMSAIAQHLKVRESMIIKGCCRLGRGNETRSAPVRLVVMRLASGELLALACSGRPRHALARYRQRWTIETMFGNLKTKGFALEATHLTDPDKLCTLLALMAFAVALTVKTGVAMARLHPIPVQEPGCVKTPTFDLRIEFPSRFRRFEN